MAAKKKKHGKDRSKPATEDQARPSPAPSRFDDTSDRIVALGNSDLPWILSIIAAAGLALIEILAAGLRIITHSDLWWAMAAGRYITNEHEIPTRDIFSYTFADQPWINMEWITQVLYYNVYHHLGENAITVLRIGVILIIFAITFGLCVARSKNVLVSLLSIALGAWICQPFLDARPQLFTFLNSIVYLVILHQFRRRGRTWVLVFLPIIMLFWVNQHFGFILGLLILLGNLGAESLKRLFTDWMARKDRFAPALTWSQIRWLGGATTITALTVLINPWGFEGYTHPIQMSSMVAGDSAFLTILEWRAPVWTGKFSPWQFWPFLGLTTLVVVGVAFVRFRDFDINDVGLAAVLAIFFALTHRRFIPLFTILTLPLLAFSTQVIWTRLRMQFSPRVKWVGAALLLASLGLVGWSRGDKVYQNYWVTNGDISLFKANIQYEFYPEKTVEFIRKIGLKGPMYNLYNWGGYLMYFLPEEKVFTDGRAQTVYTERFYKTNLKIHHGQGDWERILDQYGVKFVMISMGATNNIIQKKLRESPNWRWIFLDKFCGLWIKVCHEHREILAKHRERKLPLPESAMTYFLYGLQAANKLDWAQSAKDYRRALEFDPRRLDITCSLAISLIKLGRLDDARNVVQDGLRIRPDSIELKIEGARIDSISNRSDEALAACLSILESDPDQLTAIDIAVYADSTRTREFIETKHRRNPNNHRWLLAMGRIHELYREYEEAASYYRQAAIDTQYWNRDFANRASRRLKAASDAAEMQRRREGSALQQSLRAEKP